MYVYEALRRRLPPRLAAAAFAAAYLALIAAIVLLSLNAPADFDYGRY